MELCLLRQGNKYHFSCKISEGISGLLPVGTTGESPTLTHEENLKVVEEAIKIADGKTGWIPLEDIKAL